MNDSTSQICPCQSELCYSQCCEPLHSGKHQAETAEALMRSRYSAFCNHRIDYLVNTHHPDTRSRNLGNELKSSLHESQWIGLKILRTSRGLKNDKTGKVEFEASYIHNGQSHTLHEHSRFKRHNGAWKYLDEKG